MILVLVAQLAVGAQATPTLIRADPVPGGGTLTELRVVQPIAYGAGELLGGRLRVHAMLNLEGVTLKHGVLATGGWGEGFADRRHPHTLVHEAVATLTDAVRVPVVQWSLTAGKGFAPYGTDDPMSRPAMAFPVNHHWSQVLERLIVIAAVRAGPASLEAGLFNGDEPEGPFKWPNWSRFGDSWSVRGTVRPAAGVELQGSLAAVKSPEQRQGAGLENRKASLSARLERSTAAGTLYAFAEWAVNSEGGGFFRYHTALAEAQLSRPAGRVYLRLERTDRPEEQRVLNDPFRTVRPHLDNSNLGITRWNAVTAGVGLPLLRAGARVRAEGIVEGQYLRVNSVTGGVFDPAAWWGRNDLWMASVALRVGIGGRPHRMGRYGVAMDGAATGVAMQHH